MDSAATVLIPCQPTLPKNCRTLEDDAGRHPSSKKRLAAPYQLNPCEFSPPCSNSATLRPKLPPLNSSELPGLLRPSFVCSDSAPPNVFKPNKGFEPGISATSPIATRG